MSIRWLLAGVGIGAWSTLNNLGFLLGVTARDDLGVRLRAPRDDEDILLVLTSGETGLSLHAAALTAAACNRLRIAIVKSSTTWQHDFALTFLFNYPEAMPDSTS